MTEKFFIPRADRRLGDRYQLLDCLGDGSYGWVWRAQRLEDGCIVAVKIPKAQSKRNEDLAEGSSLVGQASHPCVVDVYWMGRVPPDREWYAIEMEYFPSITLAQLLDRGEQGFVASYDKLLGVFARVLEGCHYLHGIGISHGDIKPQNILVSAERVKLTDFGTSVLPEDMYARTRENGGTILYSSPETVGSFLPSRNPSSRFFSDIYSLGVLLYHLVTSRLPHDTLSQVARHVPFPRAIEVNSSVSPELDTFISRCLRLDPVDRWPSVGLMLDAFRDVRTAQQQFMPTRSLVSPVVSEDDWSTHAVRLLVQGDFDNAERIAQAEFDSSKDHHAFLMMIQASYRADRYFDCIHYIESHPEIVDFPSATGSDLRCLALSSYLEVRDIRMASAFADKCLLDNPSVPDILLKKASILALDSRYADAAEYLLILNRRLPNRPAILKRLVLVYEQIRDTGKAMAFLRAYRKTVPEDPWVLDRLEHYRALGFS